MLNLNGLTPGTTCAQPKQETYSQFVGFFNRSTTLTTSFSLSVAFHHIRLREFSLLCGQSFCKNVGERAVTPYHTHPRPISRIWANSRNSRPRNASQKLGDQTATRQYTCALRHPCVQPQNIDYQGTSMVWSHPAQSIAPPYKKPPLNP